ncbi:MAG: O-antigen ligase family protein [Immundisolibacteraceae bacterium]|nr:O-antigen ligase family protein [Immundisolibacteraceae bacterium]
MENLKKREDLGLPFIILLFYLFLEFFRPFDIFTPLKVLHLPFFLAIFLIAASATRSNREIFIKNRISLFLLLFYSFSLLSVVWSELTSKWYICSKGGFLNLIPVFASTCLFVDTPKKLRLISILIIGAHLFLAIWSLIFLGRGPGGFLEDENDLALSLATFLPLVLFFSEIPHLRRSHRWLLILILVTMILAVFNTNSRGGFLALTGALGVSFLLTKKKKQYLAVLLTATLFALPVIGPEYIEQIKTIDDTTEGTANERLWSWKLGIDMYKDHPIAGIGLCNYPFYVGIYEEVGLGGQWGDIRRSISYRVAHSVFFSILPELGTIGTFLFLAGIFCFFKNLKSLNLPPISSQLSVQQSNNIATFTALRNALIASMTGWLIASTFITALWGYPQFWLLCGMGVALLHSTQTIKY